ncbi:hypothetical protein TNCV_3588961 [Trichonephila clavipes]|nr:hypothetical protein TNCV_3588961 [Trichonephila clavipes]
MVQAQISPSFLDLGPKLRDLTPIASCCLLGNRTKNECLSNLGNVVKPLTEDWFPDGDGIYQDDNAIPHHVQTVQT